MKYSGDIPIEDVDENLLIDTLDDLPLTYVETAALQERIIALIDSLPYKHRQCVLLHYYQNLSYADIADIMGCKESDVRNNLYRARQIMKVELEDEQKNNTKLWSASPLVAIGPALSAIFERSAAATVPAGAAQRILENAGIYAAVLAAQHAAFVQTILNGLKAVALTAAITTGTVAVAHTVDGVIHPPPPTPPAVVSTDNIPQDAINHGTAGWGVEDKPVQAVVNTLSGRVSLDNSSAVDPNARHGLAGVTVELINAEDDSAAATQTTRGGINHGIFQFDEVPPGSYRVKVHLPNDAEIAGSAENQTGSDGTVWLEQDGNDTFTFEADEPRDIQDVNLTVRLKAAISGSVVLDIAGGTEGISLPDMTVNLLDPQGRMVAMAKVDAAGRYAFENPLISQSGTYTVQFSLTGSHGIGALYDSISVRLAPGQSQTIAAHTLQDTEAPHIVVEISGGEMGTSHLNPSHVEIKASDATPVSIHWQLTDFSTGAKTASGASNDELAAAVAALPSGSYTLTAAATDQAGNTASASRLITINR